MAEFSGSSESANSSPPPIRSPYELLFLELRARFSHDHDPFSYLRARTALVNSLVISTAQRVFAVIPVQRFAITAVGGYGRGELFPYSDVDLLVLLTSDADLPLMRDPLAEFIRNLWDAGLRISHSVRTVPECMRLKEENTELHISLLDLRYLWGSESVAGHLSSELPQFFKDNSLRFREELTELARQRHSRGNETVYHQEPNIKEAPGGLRDLHLLGWLNQLAPQQQAIEDSLSELAEARRFLYALRCFLHLETGRDTNLLSFELQDLAAEQLPPTPISPEEWMRSYYKHARAIYQPARHAMHAVQDQRRSLRRQWKGVRSRFSRHEFTIWRDQVRLENPTETLSSVDGLFRIFIFLAGTGLQLTWHSQRLVRGFVATRAAEIQAKPPVWQDWTILLGQPHAAAALHEMQQTGLLGCLLEEWNKIDSLVVRDFYHRYTVDEHTLVAIRTIEDILAKRDAVPPRLQEILTNDDNYAVLKFAVLLHDIGKGTDPTDHVKGSMRTASAIMQRLGAPSAEADEIVFLIENHLELSLVMNGRDLEDPATARYLTARVKTLERLRLLTLFTYADISAVNPTAMTPWRFEQLWRVYMLGSEQLTHDLVSERIPPDATAGEVFYSAEMNRFLEGLPTRYLRTHSLADIEHHFSLKERAGTEGVAVEISPESGAYVATVIARDRPGLFADVCGALAAFGMSIVKADAFSNAAALVVDAFRFVDPMRTLELNPDERRILQRTIEGVLLGHLDVHELLKRRRDPRVPSNAAKIAPSVRFNNEASERATLIDFVGEDRPGLLFDLSSAISHRNCNIEVVMIDTEGHKAIDVFYVTEDRHKLSEATQADLKTALLRAAAR